MAAALNHDEAEYIRYGNYQTHERAPSFQDGDVAVEVAVRDMVKAISTNFEFWRETNKRLEVKFD